MLCSRYVEKEKKMLDTILVQWNPIELKKKILRSQKLRLFIQRVLLKGNHTSWDYHPYKDASKTFIRSSRDANVTITKGLARLPYVEPVPPEHPRG